MTRTNTSATRTREGLSESVCLATAFVDGDVFSEMRVLFTLLCSGVPTSLVKASNVVLAGLYEILLCQTVGVEIRSWSSVRLGLACAGKGIVRITV